MADRVMTTEEPMLEACPFCGPQIEESGLQPALIEHSTAYITEWSVRCPNCSVEVGDEYRDEAIAAWNTRVSRTPPVDQDEVERDDLAARLALVIYGSVDCLTMHQAQHAAHKVVASIGSGAGDVREALEYALDGLDSIAGDRTPEFFPETSYDCAKRVAAKVRALSSDARDQSNDR